jgi:hypothetical protein
LGLFDESIHPCLPIPIHGNGTSIVNPQAQKELGCLLKELFAAGELSARNSLIHSFLQVGWQGNVDHADLRAVFYAMGYHFASSDFAGTHYAARRGMVVGPTVALRHE